jgi:hypothetical protein
MNGSHYLMSGLAAMMLMAGAPADAKTGTSASAANVATNGTEAAPYGGATKARQPLICRRWANTGSRIAKQKACHTAEEWKRIEDGDY